MTEQLENVELNNRIRAENASYLYKHLKNNKDLIFPQSEFDMRNIYIDFPILCKNKEYKDHIFNRWKNQVQLLLALIFSRGYSM